MAKFTFGVLVQDQRNISAAFGFGPTDAFDDSSIDKPVKLATTANLAAVSAPSGFTAPTSNYIKCQLGDEIEGFVSSVSPETVNSGYSFGSIQTWGRKIARVDSDQVNTSGHTALIVGDKVVAGTVVADGTYATNQQPSVRSGSPAIFVWRVISLLGGTGAVGTPVLIERAS